MRTTTILILILVSFTSIAQEKELDAFRQVFNDAEKSEKQVILVFGHEYCGWCRVFDRYHADPEVKKILGPEYIIHKIDIINSKEGEKLYNHYELPGTPVWMIFNCKMDLLSNGKNPDGQIIGYPYKESEISLYLEEIKRTSGGIDENDLEILKGKLQYYGDSRKK